MYILPLIIDLDRLFTAAYHRTEMTSKNQNNSVTEYSDKFHIV